MRNNVHIAVHCEKKVNKEERRIQKHSTPDFRDSKLLTLIPTRVLSKAERQHAIVTQCCVTKEIKGCCS